MNKNAIITGILLVIILLYNNLPAQETALEIEYSTYDLRDPFKNPWEEGEIATAPSGSEPRTEDSSLPEGFVIQGAVWGIEPAKVIINDQVAGIGDTILDVQVLKIRKEGIHLLYKGRKFIIKPQ